MRKISWKRNHLDATLEALVFYMKQFPTTSTRYRALHAMFRNLGDAALSEVPFVIEVGQSGSSELPDDYQRVVDAVRERRTIERQSAGR